MRELLVACLVLTLGVLPTSRGAEIIIRGQATGFAGETLRAYHYDDYLTFRKKMIRQVEVGDDESFELRIDQSQTDYLMLSIGRKSAALYIEPGEVYNITLNDDIEENKSRLYDQRLKLKFSFPDRTELNQLIIAYGKDYEQLVENHRREFLTKSALPLIREFGDSVRGAYHYARSPYFQTYITYSLAALEEAASGADAGIYEAYIKNKPMQFDHIEYMNFFKQFYQKRFEDLTLGKYSFSVMSAVNGTTNYQKLLEIVREQPFVDDDTMAQVYMVNGLREEYHGEAFEQHKVIYFLEKVREAAVTDEVRRLVDNTIHTLTYLSQGYAAPTFEVETTSGAHLKLDELGDRYLLMNFWSMGSTSGVRQLQLLQTYHEKYGDQVEMISVNMDDKLDRAEKYFAEKGYHWHLVHHKSDPGLLDRYRIYGTPFYLLIDRDGKILRYPAPSPEGQLEKLLYDITSK